MEVAYINSPIGVIEIVGADSGIISISLNSEHDISENIPVCLQDCVKQLQLYFSHDLKMFNLKYNIEGTSFQRRVWDALQVIPFGETVSYQDIAIAIGNPKAQQAVGTAIGKNPCAITIPCHRVINKNGGIGGYAGGLENKVFLLKHEGSRPNKF